ncbi:MAG: SH3 domain-containing protein [Fimbriimonadaceae bacterium]|nr:SH3 domain-containing protein [Fimbriimonadaceae bacterium]
MSAASTRTSDSSAPVAENADDERQGIPEGRSSSVTVTGSGAQDARGSSSRLPLWIGAFAVGLVALIAIFGADRQGLSGLSQARAPTLDSAVREQVESPRVYAVAALNANLRALPSTRSKVIGTLKRGAPVVALEQRDGFIKLRANGDVEGWISSDIVIEMADLTRLQSSSPAEYIAARERLKPIEKLTEYLDQVSPQVRVLLSQIEGGQDSLAMTVGEIENHERPGVETDSAAGLWFSLAARAAADSGDHVEAIRLVTAAIYADPLKVDYHTALGFSAIALGQRELLEVQAAILPALAPGATNTWIIVGINAALTGKTDLAQGALLAALDRSRNPATTVRVLRGMAARSEDGAVVAAVNAALDAGNEAPSEASAARLKQ